MSTRLYIIPVAFLCSLQTVFAQTNSESQNEMLFKDALSYFGKIIHYSAVKAEDSIQLISPIAIKKFKQLYLPQNKGKHIEGYIADTYRFFRMYDSAIHWYKKDLDVKKDSISISTSNEFIALSLLEQGYLDSSKAYMDISAKYASKGESVNFPCIVSYAYKIYGNTDTISVNTLKSKSINPCFYSIQVFKTLLQYRTTLYSKKDPGFSSESIAQKENNCH